MSGTVRCWAPTCTLRSPICWPAETSVPRRHISVPNETRGPRHTSALAAPAVTTATALAYPLTKTPTRSPITTTRRWDRSAVAAAPLQLPARADRSQRGKMILVHRYAAMDVRRLAIFLEVVDQGGFTRAADALDISQPSVSQAVRELENDLGTPLFHRLD